MDAQKVLVIAPLALQAPKLPGVRFEMDAIGKWHQMTVITEVGRYDVLSIAAEGEQQDIYHFAGHLSEIGFEANHVVIPFDSLIMIIKTAAPKLVIFNTCESAAIAARVISQSNSDCIYTTRTVDDTRSAEFAIAFYAVLRRESVTSYAQARQIVDPQDDTFRYVSSGRNNPPVTAIEPVAMPSTIAERIQREINDVKERVKAIEGFLSGNLGEPGLTAQVRGIKTDIRNIEREITVIEALDARLDRLESILERYDPMWRAMELSYTSKVNIPIYVFYGVLLVVIATIAITFPIIWLGRGG